MSHTILIVDDELGVITAMQYVFELHKYRVLTARDGLSAITIAESQPIDLALVDIHMPGIDGFETCRALRAGRGDLPVWMMSGVYNPATLAAAAEAGAVSLLRKPFQFAPLLREIEARMGRSRQHQLA